jgi:hypothetical protein
MIRHEQKYLAEPSVIILVVSRCLDDRRARGFRAELILATRLGVEGDEE